VGSAGNYGGVEPGNKVQQAFLGGFWE